MRNFQSNVPEKTHGRVPRRFLKNEQGGLIRTIILVVIFLLVISYFGLNLRDVINDPTTQNNFSYVWGEVVRIWTAYLKEPVLWVWREIIVKYVVMLGINN